MFFKMPTTVFAEENCVQRHGKDLAALGRRALLVTGRHSAKANGALGDVQDALQSHGVSFVLFDEVEENPSVDTVMRAAALSVEENVDFIIGIGGGSPLDAAKAIAVMSSNSTADAGFLYRDVPCSALPIAAVPTTCGTGSEVTPYAVLTVPEKRTKVTMAHHVFPSLALVDGKYLVAAPMRLLRSTAMDALAHLWESWIHSNATEMSRMLVKDGLSVWKRSKAVLLEQRQACAEDYANMMFASMLAGMAISHTGTSLPHGLSYRLTFELHMAHGKAVGRFLAGYLQEAPKEDRETLLRLADFTDLDAFRQFYDSVCGMDDVPEDLLEQSVTGLLQNKRKLGACPYPVDESVLRRIAGLK